MVAMIASPPLCQRPRGIRCLLAPRIEVSFGRSQKRRGVSGDNKALLALAPWLVGDYGAKELPTLTIEAHHLKLFINSVIRGARVDRHAWQ